jgi:uracil-DNA glycosylase
MQEALFAQPTSTNPSAAMSGRMQVAIEPSWQQALGEEFDKPYFQELTAFLKAEKAEGKSIYPAGKDIFRAFELTPVGNVKVVILGQDPYHGNGQAHGLSFSVPRGIAVPPSLQNIYKEVAQDMGLPIPKHGNLTHWAEQGVLLINATLTVESSRAGSHQKRGWETFTDAVIKHISQAHTGVVFLLWGRFAKDKGQLIDPRRHHVLTAAHPSPFAADKGFFGCKHFSRANQLLTQQGKTPIDWEIPN